MTFLEAKAKLAELAKDKHYSLQYQLSTFPSFKDFPSWEESTVGVYIDGTKWHSAKTWEEAFNSLDNQLNPPTEVDLTECPET